MTCERSFSTALLALYSCTKPRIGAAEHDGQHDAGIDPFPNDGGDDRRKDQDED